MVYYNDIKEMVGNTPILKLNNLNVKKCWYICQVGEF